MPKLLMIVALACALGGCGEEPPLIESFCVEIPDPSLPSPNNTELIPADPPYDQVKYSWNCVNQFFIEERWGRNEADCWFKLETYTYPKEGCVESLPEELREGSVVKTQAR